MIKIIQTVKDQANFYSRIFTYKKTWEDFCNLIHNALGHYTLTIKDIEDLENNTVEEMTAKVLIPYVTDYIVFQQDSKHLMIETYNSDYDFGMFERKEFMFQVIQETSDKTADKIIPNEIIMAKALAELNEYANNHPCSTQENHYADSFF